MKIKNIIAILILICTAFVFTVGIYAADAQVQEVSKETEAVTAAGTTEAVTTEPENKKESFLTLWYLPIIVIVIAVAAVIAVRIVIMKRIFKK